MEQVERVPGGIGADLDSAFPSRRSGISSGTGAAAGPASGPDRRVWLHFRSSWPLSGLR